MPASHEALGISRQASFPPERLVGVLYLPRQDPPYLLVLPEMWYDLDIEEIFTIRDASKD